MTPAGLRLISKPLRSLSISLLNANLKIPFRDWDLENNFINVSGGSNPIDIWWFNNNVQDSNIPILITNIDGNIVINPDALDIDNDGLGYGFLEFFCGEVPDNCVDNTLDECPNDPLNLSLIHI